MLASVLCTKGSWSPGVGIVVQLERIVLAIRRLKASSCRQLNEPNAMRLRDGRGLDGSPSIGLDFAIHQHKDMTRILVRKGAE